MTEPKTNKEQLELLELLEAKEAQVKYNKLSTLYPDAGPYRRDEYPKHVDFMNAGKEYSQRAFIAANRVGKTLLGAVEMAYHLTGLYPKWWQGRKFLNPINAWAAGISNQSTKEILQNELLGELSDIGTGTIPRDLIVKVTKKPGVADAVETVYVKHVSGGNSSVTFKSYEQGWDSFQGTKRQVIWLDEEPKDPKIYTECLTRTMDKYNPGMIMCTFTPLMGLSDVTLKLVPSGKVPINHVDPNAPYVYATQVGWDDVPHISDKQKKELIDSYPIHERNCRTKGEIGLGAGSIYPYLEEGITVEPFAIPAYWPKGYGFDVGWKKTAAVFGARDPDSGVVYIHSEHYEGRAAPAVHARAIMDRGEYLIGAIDPAAGGASQADGRTLRELYEEAGLTLETANNSVEAGILKTGQMFEAGQLKIFSSCPNTLQEYRLYHRNEDGKIVKSRDHLMDALRYFIMTGLDWMMTESFGMDNGFDFTDDRGRDDITGY